MTIGEARSAGGSWTWARADSGGSQTAPAKIAASSQAGHPRRRRGRTVASACRERPPWRSGRSDNPIPQAAERHGGRSLQRGRNAEVVFASIRRELRPRREPAAQARRRWAAGRVRSGIFRGWRFSRQASVLSRATGATSGATPGCESDPKLRKAAEWRADYRSDARANQGGFFSPLHAQSLSSSHLAVAYPQLVVPIRRPHDGGLHNRVKKTVDSEQPYIVRLSRRASPDYAESRKAAQASCLDCLNRVRKPVLCRLYIIRVRAFGRARGIHANKLVIQFQPG
jgi:hypothetical protein